MPVNKPDVDMTYCLGCVKRMLEACKPVLSDEDYKRLMDRVLGVDDYVVQKEIFGHYVNIITRK